MTNALFMHDFSVSNKLKKSIHFKTLTILQLSLSMNPLWLFWILNTFLNILFTLTQNITNYCTNYKLHFLWFCCDETESSRCNLQEIILRKDSENPQLNWNARRLFLCEENCSAVYRPCSSKINCTLENRKCVCVYTFSDDSM